MRLMRAGAALAAIDVQPTATLVPLARRRFSRRSAPRGGCVDAERAWLRAARALCFQVSAFNSRGVGRAATRGVKLFT